jgi:hypothetical protein
MLPRLFKDARVVNGKRGYHLLSPHDRLLQVVNVSSLLES